MFGLDYWDLPTKRKSNPEFMVGLDTEVGKIKDSLITLFYCDFVCI